MDTPPVTDKKTLVNSLTKTSLTPCRRVGLGRPSSGSVKKLMQLRTVNTPSHNSLEIENPRSSAIHQNETIDTPPCSLPLKVPFNLSNVQSTGRVRRCLTQDHKINQLQSVKRTCNEIKTENGVIGISNESIVNCSGFVEESNNNKSFKKLKSKLSSGSNEDRNIVCENENPSVCKNGSVKLLTDMNQFEKNKEVREKDIVQLMHSLLEKKKKLDQLKVQETYAKKHNLEELRAQTSRWRTAGQEALHYCVKLTREAGHPVTIHKLMVQHGFPQDLMAYNPDDDDFE